MIVGLGIDLLENGRMERELSRGDWLRDDGIFTPEEITDCSATRGPALRFAACFAAKEAVCKALRVQVSDLAMFREAEIRIGRNGQNQVVLHERLKTESERLGVRGIHLSFVHHAAQTCALVILEA